MAEHFFVVGAQRCGTTYLYRLLEQHPDVAMARPLRPEPKFFLVGGSRDHTPEYYEETYFSHADGARVRGEKSAGYLESPTAASQIQEWFPDARIVVAVREPVARAISNYRFSVENGVEHLPIDEALLADPHRRVEKDGEWFVADGLRIASNPFLYLDRGRYVDGLDVYAQLFGPDRIHVVVFEDLVRSPECGRGVYAFLGVDDGFRPTGATRPVNASTSPLPEPRPDTLRKLSEYYREPNERLVTDFHVDVSSWSDGDV